MQDVGFLLLAGGQSRRMGGGDKNQLHLDGKPVMQHVLDRVERADAPTVINANGDPKRFDDYGLPVIADVVDGFAGPLAGILTGLEWLVAHHPNCKHLVSMATDAPFLPTDLAFRLYAETHKGFCIVQAASNGRLHPVFAIWSILLLSDLRNALVKGGVRKIVHFTEKYDCSVVTFSGSPDPFFNLNKPKDYNEACRWYS